MARGNNSRFFCLCKLIFESFAVNTFCLEGFAVFLSTWPRSPLEGQAKRKHSVTHRPELRPGGPERLQE